MGRSGNKTNFFCLVWICRVETDTIESYMHMCLAFYSSQSMNLRVALCTVCYKGRAANKLGEPEELIQCANCNRNSKHLACFHSWEFASILISQNCLRVPLLQLTPPAVVWARQPVVLPRRIPGNVWSVRPVMSVEIQMRKTRWSAVMSVTVDTTPSVLASPVYPQVGTELR